jgi:organic radical activating enzyme
VGWYCDAAYTWDKTHPGYYTGQRLIDPIVLVDEVQQEWERVFGVDPLTASLQPNLVLTGGEPLLQQRKLARLVPELRDWHIEIETNGTIAPDEAFSAAQINCSPKLESSGNELRARRRLAPLKSIDAFTDHWFKFVVATEDDMAEIKELMDVINGGDFSRVLLMAEGVEAEELSIKTERLRHTADELGAMVTERNHIYWYGNKRRT